MLTYIYTFIYICMRLHACISVTLHRIIQKRSCIVHTCQFFARECHVYVFPHITVTRVHSAGTVTWTLGHYNEVWSWHKAHHSDLKVVKLAQSTSLGPHVTTVKCEATTRATRLDLRSPQCKSRGPCVHCLINYSIHDRLGESIP